RLMLKPSGNLKAGSAEGVSQPWLPNQTRSTARKNAAPGPSTTELNFCGSPLMDATGISARLKDSGPGRQKNRGQKNEAESRRFIQLIQRRGCSAIQQTDGEHLHGLCAKNLLARRAAEKQKENISDSGLSINMPPLTGLGRADQLA